MTDVSPEMRFDENNSERTMWSLAVDNTVVVGGFFFVLRCFFF